MFIIFYQIENKMGDDLFLPMLSLFNLPKNFFDLNVPPFSLPVDLNDDKFTICLLTGKIVSFDHFSYSMNISCRNLRIFLCSPVIEWQKIIWNYDLQLLWKSKSFIKFVLYKQIQGYWYWLKNWFLLSLNDSTIEYIIDNLLSGFWTSKINI